MSQLSLKNPVAIAKFHLKFRLQTTGLSVGLLHFLRFYPLPLRTVIVRIATLLARDLPVTYATLNERNTTPLGPWRSFPKGIVRSLQNRQ